jgi:hypothetical protein
MSSERISLILLFSTLAMILRVSLISSGILTVVVGIFGLLKLIYLFQEAVSRLKCKYLDPNIRDVSSPDFFSGILFLQARLNDRLSQ